MVERAGGSASLRRYWDQYQDQILLEKLFEIGPVSGWYARGMIIRNKVWLDFTEGGNSNAYPWMPPYMLIVDKFGGEPEELPWNMYHELREYNKMSNGASYDPAHDYSKVGEQQIRDHPDLFDRMWNIERNLLLERWQAGKEIDLNAMREKRR